MLLPAGKHTPLKLRVDNVYYCYAKISGLARGDLVLFYEPRKGGGRGVAMGAAVILERVIDTPQILHEQFSGLGVYDLPQIQEHANSRGRAMAIRFGLFELFSTPVGLSRIRALLGRHTNLQGLSPVPRDVFEAIRSEGLA